MIEVKTPAEQFFDKDGTALDAGYIYVGTAGLNPETSPVALFWDQAGTIPATNPIRTVNGYPSKNGSVSRFFTADSTYSITIKTKNGEIVQSALNSNSGIFDELQGATGAANVGYDNASSGMAADNVQEAIDELKGAEEGYTALIDDLTKQFTGINLFPNPAFSINRNGYVSGTATTTALEETLDDIKVVVSGESLAFSATDFGNEIVTPAGGVEVVIDGSAVTGGEYACTWGGTGVLTVDGTVVSKGETFTLSPGWTALLELSGTFSKFQFTRPYSLGTFEYPYRLGVDEESTRKALNAAGAAPVYAARARLTAAGATGAIKSSGNIASVTRLLPGSYRIVFLVKPPNDTYQIVGSQNQTNSVYGTTESIDGSAYSNKSDAGFDVATWPAGSGGPADMHEFSFVCYW